LSGSDSEKHPTVDVGTLIERGDIDVSISTRESEDDARVRRFKEIAGFLIAVSSIVVAMGTSVYLIFFHSVASADERKWALGTISAILGAVGGYLVGRKGI
jgi:hypothetical protein